MCEIDFDDDGPSCWNETTPRPACRATGDSMGLSPSLAAYCFVDRRRRDPMTGNSFLAESCAEAESLIRTGWTP